MSELTHKDWIDKASKIRFCDNAFIDGKAVPARSGRTFASLNPATGETLAEVASCGEEDIDLAVAAARRSFESGVWSRSSPAHRKQVLLRLAELLRENLHELALLESLDMGKLVKDAASIDVPGSAAIFQWYAEAIDKMEGAVANTLPDALHYILRQSMGGCGLIVAWNYPLMMAAWKLGPALATSGAKTNCWGSGCCICCRCFRFQVPDLRLRLGRIRECRRAGIRARGRWPTTWKSELHAPCPS